MGHYSQNYRWLLWFAPFRALSISAAYLTPFFLEKGLSTTEIFVLQSIFSLAYVVWEVPSGWVADRIGRARSIQLSVPFAAAGMLAYGFSDHFWQFVACELLLAVANGLISGADTALLIDSLKASNRFGEYVRLQQRINACNYAAVALGVPVSFLLVRHVGISATIVADGLLTLAGGVLVWRLVEPPVHHAEELDGSTAWQATKRLFCNRECRRLVTLGMVLSTSTYIGFWLSAPYYASVGLPATAFGAILAGRSLLKAWLSTHVDSERHLKPALAAYALLAGLPYVFMSSGSLWLVWAVLGHDVVHALQGAPLARRYNEHMPGRYRAMLNSVVGLQMRLCFAVLGPVVGLTVDWLGLQRGLMVLGVTLSAAAAVAYMRLLQTGTLNERR